MFESTKIIELGSCAFRQWRATQSHCKFVHGYQLKAKFWFGCSKLDDKNWAVDFGGLKELKAILQKQFDHTLCIAEDDPLLPSFIQLHDNGGCDLRIMHSVGIEKTAEWCYKAAKEYLSDKYGYRCWVSKVEVWEHAENSAIFQELS
jgi:6-pyruvoyltetrahydropterin/6-carboxytetrahydropterin synthase